MGKPFAAVAVARRGRRKRRPACFLFLFSVCCLVLQFVDPAALCAQEKPTKEIYQDFRLKRPLLESFRLTGLDVAEEVKAEDEGLRITLPAVRGHHWPGEVAFNDSLSGDFEMTGTYELLSGARPAKGYGVGVSLIVANDDQRGKFAKVSRLFRAQEGSVHLTEYWKPYQVKSKETEAKAGQLRLVRVGPSLRYLVSDGPGQEFREIWFQKNFGDEDLHHVRFAVTDSGEPGNPVDARLIDLRIRMGTILSDRALQPAPLAAPTPPKDSAPAANEAGASGRGWLAALIIVALGVVLSLAVGVGAWLFIRRRRLTAKRPETQVRTPQRSAGAIVVSCSSCGKKLKVKTAHAGKKVKCNQCGTDVMVPNVPADEPDDG